MTDGQDKRLEITFTSKVTLTVGELGDDLEAIYDGLEEYSDHLEITRITLVNKKE